MVSVLLLVLVLGVLVVFRSYSTGNSTFIGSSPDDDVLQIEEKLVTARFPYELHLYPGLFGPGSDARVGDSVFCISRNKRSEFTRAVVRKISGDSVLVEKIATTGKSPATSTWNHDTNDRQTNERWFKRVRIVKDYSSSSTTSSRPKGVVVTCCETWHYRRLVCSVEKGDRVLEIGCDVGLTTAALASRAGDKLVIGLDKSRKSIEMARERYPSLRFVQEDINLDGTGLRKMAAKLFAHQSLVSPEQKGRPEQGKGLLSKESIIFDKIFIDINGMRSLKDVRQLLISVMRELKPRLIVVKSVHLYNQQRSIIHESSYLNKRETKFAWWQLGRHQSPEILKDKSS